MAAVAATATTAAAATTLFPIFPSSPRGKQRAFSSCCSFRVPDVSTRSNRGLRSGSFDAWSGLRNLGISFERSEIRGRKCGGRRRMVVVHASLFGVGAPEALVVGVVALLVFGPKGLAEVARTLGRTLRTFQPTIRELQDVSRDFKSTLEREIGLDEVQSSLKNTYTPTSPVVIEKPQSAIDSTNSSQPTSTTITYSGEDILKTDELSPSVSAIETSVVSDPLPVMSSEVTAEAPAAFETDKSTERSVLNS